jgi:hypothetical protein
MQKAPTSAREIGAFVAADPAGSASRPPRPRKSLNDLVGIWEVAGHADFTLARTGAERRGLQVPQVVTGVGLQALRGVIVVDDAAEQVE